ncbi:MAG: alpha/beta fold hydrolase [Anaerolineae bacterium]|nr:alpha/beta fold hydrolase [Anaerolineae bacterium]
MRELRFVLGVLFLIAPSVGLLPAAAQDDLPNEYTFDSGASIRYPAGWTVEQTEDDFWVLTGPDVDVFVSDAAELRALGITTNDLATLLGEYFYPMDESITFDPANVQMIDLDGREAAAYRYTDIMEDGRSFECVLIAVPFSSGDTGLLDAALYAEEPDSDLDVLYEIAAAFDAAGAPDVASVPDAEDEPPARTGTVGAYQPGACPFDFPLPEGLVEGDNLECGWLTVPEDYDAPDGPTLELAVAILHSLSDDPLPDPIIYLEGGPGGSALVGIDFWVDTPLRADRDFILIDQRGTGYSKPTLDCWELYEESEDDDRDLYMACYARLIAEGINLSAYNSANNAADIVALWEALDYDAVNLYGISYGTRLALTVMRDHPAGLRSVVLDSVYPPQANALDEQSVHGALAMLHLFDSCAADAACSAAYGDLEAKFFSLVDQLNAEPYIFTDEYGVEDEVTGDALVDALFDALYATFAVPTLPYGIYLLDQGEYDLGLDVLSGNYTVAELEAIAAGEDPSAGLEVEEAGEETGETVDGDSEGMHNSVECYEEIHFNAYDRAVAFVEANDIPAQLAGSQLSDVEYSLELCEYWQVGQSGPEENEPVVSDVPTLVLAGSYDPITPVSWSQSAADYLSSSYFFEFPNAGHGAIDAGDCALAVIQAFLDDPAAEPDASCIADIEVEFFIGDLSLVDQFDALYGEEEAE